MDEVVVVKLILVFSTIVRLRFCCTYHQTDIKLTRTFLADDVFTIDVFFF